MNLPDVPLLSMLKSRMSWLEARQDVLSQNVANADTPGYVAHDLKPMDFESLLKNAGGSQFQPGLAVTDSRHIAITSSSNAFASVPTSTSRRSRSPSPPPPSGKMTASAPAAWSSAPTSSIRPKAGLPSPAD